MRITVTAAKGKEVVSVPPSRFFRCKDASAAFGLKLDRGDSYEIDPGDEFEIEPGHKEFTQVTFEVLDGKTLTVDFLVSRTYRRNTFTRPTDELIVPSGLQMSAGGTATFPGIATAAATYSDWGVPVGSRRREIIIGNGAPTNSAVADSHLIVKIQNPVSAVWIGAAIVPRSTSHVLRTKHPVRIENGSVNNNLVTVSEIFPI